MKSKFLTGTAMAALSVALFSHSSSAATLDDVMRRLDKLEKENAELRKQVHGMSATRPAAAGPAAAAAPAGFKGNPVTHAAVATSPGPAPGPTIAGMPVKAGPLGPLIDKTTVTIYGHFYLSLYVIFNSV